LTLMMASVAHRAIDAGAGEPTTLGHPDRISDVWRRAPRIGHTLSAARVRNFATVGAGVAPVLMALGSDPLSNVHMPSRTAGSAEDWPARGAAGNDWAVWLRSAELVLNGKAANDRLLRKAAEAAIGDAQALVPFEREQLRGHVRRAIRAVPNPRGRP
jgi:hypothetical protein